MAKLGTVGGDIGAQRDAEGRKMSPKLRNGSPGTNPLKFNKPKLASSPFIIGTMPGPDTCGGCIGGKTE